MRNLRDTIFCMKTNELQDFHICISVPLTFLKNDAGEELFHKKIGFFKLVEQLNIPTKKDTTKYTNINISSSK